MESPKRYPDLNDDPISVPRFEESAGFYATARGSFTMKRIKGKNTKVEVKLRKAIWKEGYRYRLNSKRLIGKPDLVFASKRLVIFIDGDFWHGYNWEKRRMKIKTNRKYWIPKIERNIQRDKETTAALKAQGWHVLRFWEHEVEKDLEGCIQKIYSLLK